MPGGEDRVPGRGPVLTHVSVLLGVSWHHIVGGGEGEGRLCTLFLFMAES